MPAIAPLISVVVPVYNAQDFLVDCLSSVAAQEGPFELEVLVVDDGSTDASDAIARRHAGAHCLQQPNRGPGAARNAGIAAARGEFIAFLDADDLWPPGKLAAQLAVLIRQPQAALAFGDCRQFDAGGPWPRTQFEADGLGAAAWPDGEPVPSAYARLLRENFITTGSVLARRSVLAELGGFAEDLRLVEDLDLWLRIACRNPLAWCPQVCLLRRRHEANISRDVEAMSLAYLRVLDRHSAGAGGVTTSDVHALVSREHAHLAELAFARGQSGPARQHARNAFASHRSARTLWLMLRAWAMRTRSVAQEHRR